MIESIELINYGVLGIVLAWFMRINYKQMEAVKLALINNTQALKDLKSFVEVLLRRRK